MRLFNIATVTFILLLVINAAHAGRIADESILDTGKALFLENCAVCHGDEAQGTVENWQVPDAKGNYPAPPLNGSAHAWHHTLKSLMNTISNGTQSIGGNMPAWKDKLTQDERLSIIVWLTSLWPDEIYLFWEKKNKPQ